MEAFPDEGDMDMPKALAAYRDVGYPYMLMPDHVPQIDGRDPSGVAFAYCYGYIQALSGRRTQAGHMNVLLAEANVLAKRSSGRLAS